MEPPWLPTPLLGSKRKTTDSSPSPRKNGHPNNTGSSSGSKKLKLNDDKNDIADQDDLDEREREAIMLADGFEKTMSRDEKRRMKKENAKAAQKAVSRRDSPDRLRSRTTISEISPGVGFVEETADTQLRYGGVQEREEYHHRCK